MPHGCKTDSNLFKIQNLYFRIVICQKYFVYYSFTSLSVKFWN